MFELLESYLAKRDYFGAASVFSSLRTLFSTVRNQAPMGFHNAQVQFVPLDSVLHVFVVLDDLTDWEELPGDESEPALNAGVFLRAKTMHLGELWNPHYSDGILFHFMHVDEERWIEEPDPAQEETPCPF